MLIKTDAPIISERFIVHLGKMLQTHEAAVACPVFIYLCVKD